MRKTSFCLIVSLFIFVISSAFGQGPSLVAKGDAVSYVLTFTSVSMVTTGGTTVVVSSTANNVDIGSVNSSELAGALSGGYVPAGVYTQYRSTVSSTVGIKGYVASGGNVYYTRSNTITVPSATGGYDGKACDPGVFAGTPAQFEAAVAAGDPSVADYDICIFRATDTPPSFVTVDADTFVVTAGATMTEQLEVDLSNTLELWTNPGTASGMMIWPGVPDIQAI